MTTARRASRVSDGEVVAHERPGLGRDGERLARRRVDGPRHQRPADLEGEERVARARVVEPDEQRPRMGHAEPLVDQPAERADRQRAHRDPLSQLDCRRQGRPARWPGPQSLRPPVAALVRRARTKATGSAAQPADGEGEGVLAGPIDPLDVVDGHDERSVGRQRCAAGRPTARPTRLTVPTGVGPGSARPRATSRARRRGCGQSSGARVDHRRAVEQAGEHGEGQVPLGGAGPPGRGPGRREPAACSSANDHRVLLPMPASPSISERRPGDRRRATAR